MSESLSTLRSAKALAENKPHGQRIKYMSGCRCVPCRAANSRYECDRAAKRRAGEWNGLVPADAVREHARQFSELGVGYKAICDAVGYSQSSMFKIITGERKNLRAQTAKAILELTPEMAVRDGAYIDAKPTWRRIKWLMSEGLTKTEISKRLGYKTANLQIGKTRVTAATANRVERLIDRMRLGE